MVKIISTIGPSSFNKKTIQKLDEYGVDYFRINLSHTDINDFEPIVKKIQSWTNKIVCPDTEGAQLRIGKLTNDNIKLSENQKLKFYGSKNKLKLNNFYFNIEKPGEILSIGDVLNIDFNGATLQVHKIINESEIILRTLKEGTVSSNKGIGIDRNIALDSFSAKDRKIIAIANKLNLRTIFLSFCSSSDDILELRSLFDYNVEIISKIESRIALTNLEEICKESDSILIDRGDLSRDVQLEKIPRAQKYIINVANKIGKPVYVATNLMESMLENSQPTRAELNDISGAIESGVDGLVLAAETAIGKHPTDAVRILSNVINEYKNKSKSINFSEILNFETPLLNNPHGGKLIQQFSKMNRSDTKHMFNIKVDKNTISDIIQICEGTYSPVNSFMCLDEIKSVLKNNSLRNGYSWTLPIIFQIKEDCKNIPLNENILIKNEKNDDIAILKIEKIEKLDQLNQFFIDWFGTEDINHPGIANILSKGNIIISGKPFLLNDYKNYQNSTYDLTPKQTRILFHLNGWKKIIGFHTRNIPHMGHQFIQKKAMENINADCIFISPISRVTKTGDFKPKIIIKAYNKLIKSKFYNPYSVLLNKFNTYPRFCGPREAIFTAICRLNYGCSHFIIGRDHSGLGDYYSPESANELFKKININIELLKFNEIIFDQENEKYYELDTNNKFSDFRSISATKLRDEIKSGHFSKNYLISNEVYKTLKKEIKKRNIFT